MARALVTGATGYIGSRLVARLLAERWQVTALVRKRSPVLASSVQQCIYDGSMASVTAAINAARPDTVFHLASMFRAEHKPDDIALMMAANITLGTQLAEAMTAAGVRHLVNAGTAWQHLNDAPYSPVCLYAATKQAFEDVLQFYVEARGLQAVTLKIFDTYGPDDPRRKLVPMIAANLKSGATMSLTPGDDVIDFVHADDVAAAFLVAAAQLREGSMTGHERFALSGGEACSIKALVAMMEAASGRKLDARWGAYPARERDMHRPWAGGANLPGWSPAIRLADGLKSLFST